MTEKPRIIYADRAEAGPELDRLVHLEVVGPIGEDNMVPPYSTDWSAAEGLVSKLSGYCPPFEKDGRWNVCVSVPRGSASRLAESWASTRPLALCRAVLKAALPAKD